MQPLTALCFVLSGLALYFHGAGRPLATRTPLAAIALIAMSALVQTYGDVWLGVDLLLFPDALLAQKGVPFPGRMADMTALMFLLFNLCLMLPRGTPRSYRRIELAAAVGLTFAFVGFCGYILRTRGLASMGGYSAMAAHTALGFVLLFVGIVQAQRGRTWLRLALSRSYGGGVARNLLPLILGWPLFVGVIIGLMDSSMSRPNLDLAISLVGGVIVLSHVVLRLAARIDRMERDLRSAYASLRERKERLRLALSAGQMATWNWDAVSRETLWNEECFHMLGYAQGDVKPSLEAWLGRILPEDRGATEAVFRQAMERVENFTVDFRSLWPDGSCRWIEARGVFERDRSTQALRNYGVMLDVSDRKQAEAELRDSHTELARAQRLGKIGHWRLDGRRNLFTWSDELCRIFEIPVGQALDSKEFLACVHPEDRETVKACWLAALQGQPYDIEHRIVVAGRVKWIRGQAELEFDEQGQLVGGHGITQDITDKVFNQRMLETARNQAERANDAKTRFLAAVSHDLRQPIQALRLLLTVLGRKLDNPKEAKKVQERMDDALASTEAMLARFMEFASLEAGCVTVQRKIFALDELIRRVASEHGVQAEAKGLRLRVRTFPCATDSDPVLVERIVRNFLVNAIRYTERGGILVGVRRRAGALVVEVRDTGIGIPAEKRDLVFEEFRQLGNPARERDKGVGLGLAIALRTAQLLHHPLSCKSTEGKGSLFAITVPAAEFRDEPPGQEVAPEPLVTSSAHRALILVVEDDVAQAQALEMILTECGYKVMGAHEAPAALQTLKPGVQQPDLILTDYRLPGGVSGVKLIEWMRTKAGRAIPAILVTGDTQENIAAEARAANCRILYKPYTPDMLLAMLNEVLPARAVAEMNC